MNRFKFIRVKYLDDSNPECMEFDVCLGEDRVGAIVTSSFKSKKISWQLIYYANIDDKDLPSSNLYFRGSLSGAKKRMD